MLATSMMDKILGFSFLCICLLALIGTISIILIIADHFSNKKKAMQEIVRDKAKTMKALKVMSGYKYKGNEWKCTLSLEEMTEADAIIGQAGYLSTRGYINLKYDHDAEYFYPKLIEYIRAGYEPAFKFLVRVALYTTYDTIVPRTALYALEKLKKEGTINNIFIEEKENNGKSTT